MVVKITTTEDVDLELKELDSAQWSKGIKHELLTKSKKAYEKAKEKQKDVKSKRFKDIVAKGKEAKDKLYKDTKEKGVRFYDKKGSGYMKGGEKNYD